jgi:hypothetical protein
LSFQLSRLGRFSPSSPWGVVGPHQSDDGHMVQ